MSLSVDKDVAKILYNAGEAMIRDDKSDIGWVNYRGRRMHTYKGRRSPNHNDPFHHWMWGTALCFVAQLAALIATAQEVQGVYQDIQYDLESEQSPESVSVGVAFDDSDLQQPIQGL